MREDGGRRDELDASGVLFRLPMTWFADITNSVGAKHWEKF